MRLSDMQLEFDTFRSEWDKTVTDKPTTMVERVAKAICLQDDDYCFQRELNNNAGTCITCSIQARAAIEAMREVPSVAYHAYRCDEQWKDLNSTKVWNLWIDAALKE